MEHFFSSNSSGHLRSDAHQRQIIRGNADVDHTQTIGDTVKLLGDISPPPPRVSAPLGARQGGRNVGLLDFDCTFAHILTTKHRPRSSVEEKFDFSAYVLIFCRQRGQ